MSRDWVCLATPPGQRRPCGAVLAVRAGPRAIVLTAGAWVGPKRADGKKPIVCLRCRGVRLWWGEVVIR